MGSLPRELRRPAAPATPDLVAIDSAGTMWRYYGNGVKTLATTQTRIGGGLNSTNLLQIAQ